MKTYEEMAQSVLERAKTHRTIRKRRILGATAAVCVLCICLGIMLAKAPIGSEVPTLQTPTADNAVPTNQTQPTTTPIQAQVTLLYNDGTDVTYMDKDIVIPCRNQLRIQGISGLSKTEADAVAKAEQKYADDLVASYPEAIGGGWCQYYGENIVMTSISAGYFILKIEDPKQVEKVYASTKGAVGLTNLLRAEDWEYDPYATYPTPKEYMLNHDEVQQYYGVSSGGLAINWIFGNELMRLFEEDLVPLSTLHDTITITVTYLDGTIETHAIDMLFEDDGEVYAIYQGLTAVA